MAGLFFYFVPLIVFEFLMAKKETYHSLITFVLFAALCGIGYLWYTGKLDSRARVAQENVQGSSGVLKTETQFRDKLTELRMQRYKAQLGVKQLEKFKAENIEQLKEMGIDSGEEFLKSDDQGVKLAVVNLKGWVAQIGKIKQEIAYYDDAIVNVETMLDKINRERIGDSVALSEEEYIDLQKIIVDLNERLNVETDILEDEELRKLLDMEMTGKGD